LSEPREHAALAVNNASEPSGTRRVKVGCCLSSCCESLSRRPVACRNARTAKGRLRVLLVDELGPTVRSWMSTGPAVRHEAPYDRAG
jgi:hypothetical protein